jgi:hypothetical protein
MKRLALTLLLLAAAAWGAPAPPPSARAIAAALVEGGRVPISDRERALLARPDVFKEVCRIGVERGWCDPDDIENDKPETVLRFCRSMRAKEGEK